MKNKHGGKREGAGRKPASLPLHTKKFRASDEEWNKLKRLLNGDARIDFILVHEALIAYRKDDDQ